MENPTSSENASMRDIVSAEKANAVTAGVVKHDAGQSLSVLADAEGPAGMRAAKDHRGRGGRKAASAAGDATGPGTAATRSRPAELRRLLARKAADELDNSEELEGSARAYDSASALRRVRDAAVGGRKTKGASSAKPKSKAAGALGAKKGAAAKALHPQTASARRAQATRAGASPGMAKSAAETAAGTSGGPGAAIAGGVACGVLAFALTALVAGQAASAVFGFWEDEASRRSLEGLPPYITYEMVEAALECQEEYGHPAGCTLAQIICESGQGDAMSQLATRDHNLFGMKWSTAFASAPEVLGKAAWTTREEYVPGEVSTVTAHFTVFKGDAECIRFRSRVFLQAGNYRDNALIRQAMAEKSSDKMAEGLKDAGWATSSTYVESLKAALDAYGLRRFDSMTAEDLQAGSGSGDAIVEAAYSQLGVPYVWGGTTPFVGLDCSGLTQYCYRQAGISIPRNSEDQAAFGRKAPVSQAAPGDILWKPGHVAIYIGDDRYIHEPHRGAVCEISSGAAYFASAIKIR